METSHTNVPLVVVAAEARFYFRQELLIEYDRKKMRVWGRWRLQILPNNWEDASDQPVSPSCACYLISYIFLINFSGIKVCGGGGLINLALTVKRNCLKQQCHPKLSSPGCKFEFEAGKKKERKRKSWNSSCCSILCYVSHWHIYNYYINSMHSYSLGTDGFI